MDHPPIRRKKTFPIRLTRYELLHLRDLFSILLPTDTGQTISQALAGLEDRRLIEAHLWHRLGAVFKEADLPTDDDAPDFVVAATQAPPVGIFKLAEEPNTGTQEGNPSAFVQDEDQE